MDVQLEDKDALKVEMNGNQSVIRRTDSSSHRLRVTSEEAKIILFVSPDSSSDRRLRINYYTVQTRELNYPDVNSDSSFSQLPADCASDCSFCFFNSPATIIGRTKVQGTSCLTNRKKAECGCCL
jgi:hypothetical protein